MIQIRSTIIATLSVLAIVALAPTVRAQWTVTNLNPAGSVVSAAYGGFGGQQAGYAQVGGFNHAGVWTGTAASWVDLNPAGMTHSYAAGCSGGKQVGYVIQVTFGHAHASLWSGSAASWVDLHPAGAVRSVAIGVSGGQQVGLTSWTTVGGADHASLWSGTAASWVDLNPAGATDSQANGAGSGQQVGEVRVGPDQHASLWSGSAASWVDLNPTGSTFSNAYDASGGQQVGQAGVGVGGLAHAGLWSGTAASWVDLHAFLPAGFTSSRANVIASDGSFTYISGYGYNSTTSRFEALLWTRPIANHWTVTDLNPVISTQSFAYGASGGQQVGSSWVAGVSRASLWNGTVASWVYLHPAAASSSRALGASGGQQVGYATLGGFVHASLWSGTAASWVDLSPTGATDSQAYGAGSGQQVGYSRVAGVSRASLWSGTAASWVDLSPAGATASLAFSAGGGQQVGYATLGGFVHASLWSGTAASWIDLNPAAASESAAYGAGGGQQVGAAQVGGEFHASLWSGTAASWVDLSASLPDGLENATATGISTDGNFTYVSGYGINILRNRYEALLWTQPVSPNQIHYYQASKLASYTQTGAAQPAAADFWRFAGFLSSTDNVVLSASISFDAPPLTIVAMTQVTPVLRVYSSDTYADQAAMDLAYPSTTYTFTADRGAGPESADVVLPVNLFSPEVPYMTGDSYARLQSYDVSQPFDLTINGFTPVAGANNVQSNVLIEPVGPGDVFSIGIGPGETLVQIPAGTFLPSTSYSIIVDYACSVITPNAGFGAATSYATFSRDTHAMFTTLPVCPVPSIAFQPDALTVCSTGTATFSVTAAGSGPFTYQWQWQPAGAGGGAWVNLAEGDNAEVGGVPVVHAANVGAATLEARPLAGYINFSPRAFRCVVTNACGSATSNPATLTVCAADFNCSGTLTINDIFDFLAAWFAGNPAADFNHVNGITIQDIFDFLAAWFAGC